MSDPYNGPSLYVTSIEHSWMADPVIYCPSPTGKGFMPIQSVRGAGSVRLEIEMDMTPGSQAILDAIVKNHGRLNFGKAREEFLCVFCGSINALPDRFCTQCGGPRGWLM